MSVLDKLFGKKEKLGHWGVVEFTQGARDII